MKKLILKISIVLATCMFATSGYAQAYEEGKVIISAGYGFPNFGKYLINTSINNSSATNIAATGFGPLHFKAEYGFTDRFSLGVSVNYNTYGATWSELGNYNTTTYHYTIKANALAVLLRFNRHWEVNDKIDAYWGLGLGFNGLTFTETSDDPNYKNASVKSPIPVGMELTFGMRYYFTPNIGMYVEGGYAKSILQAGIVTKF